MHEKFYEEQERQEAGRLDDTIFQPPTVRTVNDIRRLVQELDPTTTITKSVPVTTQLAGLDKDNVLANYSVSAETKSQSKREILLSGFRLIKAKQDLGAIARERQDPVLVNGREMIAPVVGSTDGYVWVDPLIERWLSAKREGLLICWELPDGKYCYDLFAHRLFRKRA